MISPFRFRDNFGFVPTLETLLLRASLKIIVGRASLPKSMGYR